MGQAPQLFQCPACGWPVAYTAPACPRCGARPVAAQPSWVAPATGTRKRVGQIVLAVIIVVVLAAAAVSVAKGPQSLPRYQAGATVTAHGNTGDYAQIVVSKVSSVPSYPGALSDTPAPGTVYIQAWVTYTALQNDVQYDPLQWNVYCDKLSISNSTYLFNGPSPSLGSGKLPSGKMASGWVVYEVPPKGEVVMDFVEDHMGSTPSFEIVIRAS